MLGDENYGTGVDIWAVGCIMCEIVTGKPLLIGDCQFDMLFRMMELLGTPQESNYVGLTGLPEFRLTFP